MWNKVWLGVCISSALALTAQAGTAFVPKSSLKSTRICDLASTPAPDCFQPRPVPVVKVLLVHYGNSYGNGVDTARVGALLQRRFGEALDHEITLQFTDTLVMGLAPYSRDLTELENAVPGSPEMRTPERLERLWYYYNVGYEQLVDEIHARLIANGHRAALEDADAVLVLSEPQFEAIGYAYGGFGLTEQPAEVAWMSGGGRTEVQTDERLVDELLHELGHVLGLDHASAQCFLDSVTGMQRVKCCNESPGRNDVMSYCRDRSGVQGPYYWRYTTCTRQYLTETVAPLLLSGGNREFQPANCP